MKFSRSLLLVIFCFCYYLGSAQVPADLSKVKAAQISDMQLQQFLNQGKELGLKPEDIEAELLRRGLPREEMVQLKQRIELLEISGVQKEPVSPSDSPTNSKRRSPKKTDIYNEDSEYGSTRPLKTKSNIFGTELFSNEDLTFEPDLRMPTPKNYSIGPEDELLLSIYGLNISQQTLKVSPEGTVNVKYAGIINVNGLTVEAAAALFKSRLLKYYPGLRSGQTKLELSLGNIRSMRVTLIGAINRPGTYTLPSLATLFNALYVSGGPAENGSFRNIELIRNNKVIQRADLYEFLLKGDQKGNLRLEDNDVIRVPFANLMISLNGQVNRPAIYELRPEESLMDALEFAGGFKSKAFRGRITGTRYADLERSIIDVSGDSLKTFIPRNGDDYIIDSVINRYQNRVIISGAVFKPGAYALENGMTVKQLIDKAQGLKEDVYTGRALLVRTRPDLTRENISVDLLPLITGQESGLKLVKEDSVYVPSIFDLRDTMSVTINGAVRKPGVFRYEDSLSLKALIIKAGGFAENATGLGIEISRRKRDIDVNKNGSKIVELIRIDGNKDLGSLKEDILLHPFDIVSIKEDPFYKEQIMVKVSGEVLMPSVYTLESREERLSSLIRRSGGLLYTADTRGAKLIRQKKEHVDTLEVRRLLKTVERDTTQKDKSFLEKKSTEVAIDLNYILEHPGSIDDITLEEGDELVIPRINNMVSVEGEVFKPLDIMYETGKKMKDYLSDAGGVTQVGKKNRAFVIYANGRSAKIKRTLLIFPRYPKIYPGSSIFVPQKPKKEGLDLAKAGIFVSALTAVITAIALFTN